MYVPNQRGHRYRTGRILDFGYEGISSTGQRWSLKPEDKICEFHEIGSYGKEIKDYKDIGERLLVWTKMRCEPVEAYQNHMESLYKPLKVADSRKRRRDIGPLRPTKRALEESKERLDKKRQARSRERSRERARERSR